jgi:hypothetical protein
MASKEKPRRKQENFTDVELAICAQSQQSLADKIGFDLWVLRLKLEGKQQGC